MRSQHATSSCMPPLHWCTCRQKLAASEARRRKGHTALQEIRQEFEALLHELAWPGSNMTTPTERKSHTPVAMQQALVLDSH